MNRRSFIKTIGGLAALAAAPFRAALANACSLSPGRYWGEILVPSPPWHKLLPLIGTVNRKRFACADAEMVLFIHCTANREMSPTGLVLWRLRYTFEVKDPSTKGWNHILRPVGNNWIPCRVLPGIYATTNFAELFGADMQLKKVEAELATNCSSLRARPPGILPAVPSQLLPQM